MRTFNTVTVAPVRSLDVGDLIAREFLGGVISGKITGIAYQVFNLNDEQKAYLKDYGIDIPEGEYDTLGGPTSVLMFGNFRGEGINKDQPGHMYVDLDVNVAVFPTKKS